MYYNFGPSHDETAYHVRSAEIRRRLMCVRLWLVLYLVGVLAHGTFSIEHRLAENDQVKGVVCQLLAALSANLEHCTYLIHYDDEGR